MDIGFYIADLLRKQDYVSVPGLGTFARHKVPGSFDPDSNAFLPPSYDISFNKETNESNTLSEYISDKKNLSAATAEYFVKKFTSGILDGLEASGFAELNPLGIIQQKDGALTFDSSPNLEIAGRFFGLKPVPELRTHNPREVQDIKLVPVHPDNSVDNFINGEGTEEKSEDEEIINEDIYQSERGKRSTLLIILGAFLFAAVAAALFYIFNPATKNLVDKILPGYITNTPALPDSGRVREAAPIIKQDSLSIVSPTAAQDSGAIDSIATTVPAENQPEPAAQVIKIEIIGATFGKRSEAEAYVRTMNKKGFQAKIADDMPGKLFKVSLASFPDDQSAQAELNRIVNEVEKTAWIAKYKPKKTK